MDNPLSPSRLADAIRREWRLRHLSQPEYGFLFDPDKHVPMCPKFLYLGVLHDYSSLHRGIMRVRILPARRTNLVAECRSILKAGALRPGHAASLRGKLYFAATAAYSTVKLAGLLCNLSCSARSRPRLFLALRRPWSWLSVSSLPC